MTDLQKIVFNAVLFNVVWLICVLGGSTIAVIAVACAVTFHLVVISSDIRELGLIVVITLLGVFVDSGLLVLDVLRSPDNSVLPPPWLMSLWGIFATTLNHSTRWFQRNLTIAFIAGAIAGPLTYVTGTKLTDYEIGEPWRQSLVILAITWGVVFVLCMLAARQLARRQMAAT